MRNPLKEISAGFLWPGDCVVIVRTSSLASQLLQGWVQALTTRMFSVGAGLPAMVACQAPKI
ncbi:hypothetical protein B0D71_07950 [Pseudomonas laurylsulfativorans]|uniref:Uncharacterized protein n=1 Tax=Pseudomonas laurylsulfativorans TaxID=1943631 RepID=A0A2S3VSB2_9PSED|nr:hypothetical protein B0D71_07950 [Pseudomonas laurylsulfativorans]